MTRGQEAGSRFANQIGPGPRFDAVVISHRPNSLGYGSRRKVYRTYNPGPVGTTHPLPLGSWSSITIDYSLPNQTTVTMYSPNATPPFNTPRPYILRQGDSPLEVRRAGTLYYTITHEDSPTP